MDSGAQSCLWSRKAFLKSGFCTQDLIPVSHTMKAANTAPIKIDGATMIRLSGTTNDGETHEAAMMVYISPDTENFFLSRESMVQLGIISHDFPKLGLVITDTINSLSALTPMADDNGSSIYAPCGCLKREQPPEKPTKLPFDCIPENVNKMKEWILNRYASSTFNKCKH